MQFCAVGTLNAVIRPEDFVPVPRGTSFVPTRPRKSRREGTVTRRMPVLRKNYVLKARRHAIDDRHDLMTARDRERAAGTEVVLDVYHKQNVSDSYPCRNGHNRTGHAVSKGSLIIYKTSRSQGFTVVVGPGIGRRPPGDSQ